MVLLRIRGTSHAIKGFKAVARSDVEQYFKEDLEAACQLPHCYSALHRHAGWQALPILLSRGLKAAAQCQPASTICCSLCISWLFLSYFFLAATVCMALGTSKSTLRRIISVLMYLWYGSIDMSLELLHPSKMWSGLSPVISILALLLLFCAPPLVCVTIIIRTRAL